MKKLMMVMLAAMAIFLPEDLQAANGMKNFLAVLINGIAAVYFIVVGKAVLPVAFAMMGAAIITERVIERTGSRHSPARIPTYSKPPSLRERR